MTSTSTTTIPDHTAVHDELTLRMLGANVTFTRGQWAELLGSLRPDGDLYRRVDELLKPVAVGRTSTITAAELCESFEVKADGAESWSRIISIARSGGPGTGMPAKVTAYVDWGRIVYGADEEVVVNGDHLNTAQREAVAVTVENFKANEAVELVVWKIADPERWAFGEKPQEGIYVEFHYRDTDDLGPKAGLEVHVYAADGKVLDSQDFG